MLPGFLAVSVSSPSGFWFGSAADLPTHARGHPHQPEAMWPAVRDFLRRMQSPRCGRPFANPASSAIGAFLFLWNFNPFSSTVLYYYSTEALHFSEQFVGSLTSWHAVGLLTGSVLYGVICRMIPMRWLIHGSIVAGILATIAYWGYRDATSGVAHQYCRRRRVRDRVAHPARFGGQGVSPGNRGNDIRAAHVADQSGTALSQGIGGSIYEAMAERWGYASAFQMLVAVGALFTAGCWLLVPLLNQLTLSPRKAEGEAY